jgi:uncharacterized protein
MIEDQQEKTWVMLCHLSALAGLVLVGVGFVVGPLVVWLMKKDQYPSVDREGKESLNFQISMMIYGAIAGVLILAVIGIVLLPLVGLFNIIMVIVATVSASSGKPFRYPLTLRLIQ